MAERGQFGRRELGVGRSLDGQGNMAHEHRAPLTESSSETEDHRFGPLTIDTEHMQGFALGPNYTELQPIGFGVHGLVVSAVDQKKQRRVAAKKVKVESQLSCRYALREVRILCQLRHDNIVRVLDVLLEPNADLRSSAGGDQGSGQHPDSVSATSAPKSFQLYLISELLDTNLHVLITQRLLEADHVTLITYQLMRGLHYLRSANVIHRDLKPSNLFINCDTLLLKIGDFGLARIVDPNYNHAGHLTANLGTYWYRAPELMLSPQSYTPAVDMWAAGCVLAEMLLGRPVFTGATDIDQLKHIIDAIQLNERDWSAVLHVLPNRMLHQHPLTPQRPLAHRLNDVNHSAVDLLENLLVFDPLKRMNPSAALAHPYLQLYSRPAKEPVATEPFGIEAEVDDLPTEQLKVMINEEKNRKRGMRGLCIPASSPVDQPRVSSATLSLKVEGSKSQRTVRTSPTFDNIVHEQRRNRRNKISASVDLSFISLPNTDKQGTSDFSPCEPQKAVYSTRNFPTKLSTPPCPWKWPEVQTAPPKHTQKHSPAVSGSSATEAIVAAAMQEDGGVPILKHNPSVGKKRPMSTAQQVVCQSSVPPGFSAYPAAQMNLVQTDIKNPAPKLRRVRPNKRMLTNISDIAQADFMQLELSAGDERHNSCSTGLFTLGKIETYEEKDQTSIDRELNRKNRTASMDLSYIPTPHVQYSPGTVQLRSTTAAGFQRESRSSLVLWNSNSNSQAPNCKPDSIGKNDAATVSEDVGRKRCSDVGIRIIKSPKLHRKMFGSSVESQSPSTPTERRYSTAHFEGSSPVTPTERKFSISSMHSSQSSSRCPSWEEHQLGSNSSSTNQSQPTTNAKYPRPKSISPLLLTMTQAIEDRCSGKSSQRAGRPVRIETPPELKNMTSRIEHAQGFPSHVSSDEQISASSGDDLSKNSYTYDDLPERPPSVVSTLTIPGLSPMIDIACSPERKVSQTTLFLDDISVNKEISQIDSEIEPIDGYPPAEPMRCSSRLSVDLSFINKEQQKREEEEKDKVDVSPRKLQEDWEIESQSSQKSEWTLGEILGVPEEEVTGSRACHQQQSSASANKDGASASLQRTSDTLVSVEDCAERVCRTKLHLIPYRVLTPDVAQPPSALTTYVEDNPVPKTTPNNEFKSAIAKLEDLSLDSRRKQFTAEFFVESAGNVSTKPSGQELPKEPAAGKREQYKDHLQLDFKTPYPQRKGLCMPETLSASILSKFSQYKSEEDLVSPRSHSPRDVVGARSLTSRDVPDLSGFKQNVKENLSSLNVSIPKDFPEKRRLIKAHSTESVCSEGESSSSQKVHDSITMDRSTEDLIQFSPVGDSKSDQQESQQPQQQQWRTSSSAFKEDMAPHPECNHCLYQGDCKGPTCGNPTGQLEGPPKKDVQLLQQPLIPQRAILHGGEHTTLGESEAHRRARVARTAGVRSSLDELCYSKDVFNERQKLMGGGGRQAEREYPSGTGTVHCPWRRARPKSAKN